MPEKMGRTRSSQERLPACQFHGNNTNELLHDGNIRLRKFHCTKFDEIVTIRDCSTCKQYRPAKHSQIPDQENIDDLIAPMGSSSSILIQRGRPQWVGRTPRYPWSYPVTVVIPHLHTIEQLQLTVALWQHQTIQPYILIIDTGSPSEIRQKVEHMRDDNVEAHFIGAHGYKHSSEPVSVAQDLAMILCRSEYMFCTHVDSFPRRRNLLEWYLKLCNAERPVVGYGMSDRSWASSDWIEYVGHVALMMHMPTVRQKNVTWGFEKQRERGMPNHIGAGWPDTEVPFNMSLKQAGIKPYLIGREVNSARQRDDNIDHVRTFTGSKVYGHKGYHRIASRWMISAMAEAKERLEVWKGESKLHYSVPQ